MSLLLLMLPPGPPGHYGHAISHDGQTLASHGSAAAALLPPAGRGVEVVAVVPATQLSWQRVALPKGIGPGSPRLRATLAGLLEDKLLDDADQLHFALAPGASSAGGECWVAVCSRPWLQAHLHALDAAQRPVSRIVPELAPQEGPPYLVITGNDEQAQLLLAGEAIHGGVQALPLAPATLGLLPHDDTGALPESATVLAEPAAAALAERLLQRPVALQTPPERALAASRRAWDLAQLDLARSSRARTAKRLGTLWRDLLHAPAWRPARWGLALLALAHLVGLNVWAWQERADLRARRAQVQSVLTDTFPHVKVVVDAPVQMAREVALLRQAAGAPSARDLEPMLAALGATGSHAIAPTAIEYEAGTLHAKGVELDAGALTELGARLRPLGYRAETAEGGLRLRLEDTP
ncbi:general secretion pathway protein GspL [Comamonadaceae bacterium OH2545_COT-014]|nr:general secretion pathway protein GspL [Comamonadaceae bacterium OH2545_COT-014]